MFMKYTKLLLTTLTLLIMYQSTQAQTGSWKLAGNSLAGTEKLGSTNEKPVRFFSNNIQRMTLTSSGRLGIGTVAPNAPLHIALGNPGFSSIAGVTIVTESITDNAINILAPSTKN